MDRIASETTMAASQDTGSASEPSYRAYELDDGDHVVGFVPVPENSDDEAMAHMRRIADGRTMELWDRGRRVGRTPARDQQT